MYQVPVLAALIAAVIIFVDGGSGAVGTVTAHFQLTTIQGNLSGTCVTPCAAMVNAYGDGTDQTVDTAFTREFHSLLYMWDFGDPGSGNWNYGARAEAGLSSPKNLDSGPISGHVYETAGTYTITLTVINPSGDLSTETRQVVATNPDSYFSAANTFCFANSTSDWTGCPLATGATCSSQHCLVVSAVGHPSFATAIANGDNCDGVNDCANADPGGGKRRIYLRRGDTFTVGGNLIYLLQDDTTPGLVDAFGSGALPHIDASGGGEFSVGTSWTIAHVHYTRLSGIRMPGQADGSSGSATGRRDGTTWFASDVNYGLNWIDSQAADNTFTRFTERVAFIDMRFIGTPVGGAENYAAFMAFDYVLLMGVSIDNGSPAVVNVGPYATLRTNHLAYAVFSHNSWRGAASGHEHMQIRAWDTMDPSMYGTDAEDNRYNIFRDSFYEEPGDGHGYGDRFCIDSGCQCGDGGCPDSDVNAGRIVDAREYIYEDNFIRCDTRSSPSIATRFGMLNFQGGRFTIRNNVFDLQNCINTGIGGYALVAVNGVPSSIEGGSAIDGDVNIYNNTIFADHGFGTDSVLMTRTTGNVGSHVNSGCPASNCYERNNLWVWPGYSGDVTPNNIAGFTSSNSFVTTIENVFAVTPVPEQALTEIDDFKISSSTASGFPRDAGYDFSAGTDTNRWVYDDANGFCRDDGQWDMGAWEYGATAVCD